MAGSCQVLVPIREGRLLEEAADGRVLDHGGSCDYFVGPIFYFLGYIWGTLGDTFIFPPHIYLGSWQTINFGEKKLGTIGVALIS